MGHLSIVVNGQSYSWELADNSGDGAVFFEDSISTGGKNNGNTSMNVDSSDSYIARRSTLGAAIGVFLDLTSEEEERLENYLSNLQSSEDGYDLLTRNCATVIRDALSILGINFESGILASRTPEGVFRELETSSRAIGQTYYEKTYRK